MRLRNTIQSLLFPFAALITTACADPGCPSGSMEIQGRCRLIEPVTCLPGTVQVGDGCKPSMTDAGTLTGASTESNESVPSGTVGGQGGRAAGDSGSPVIGQGSAQGGNAQAAAGASGGAGRASEPGQPGQGTAAACLGRAGTHVCDGKIMRGCGTDASAGSEQACLSERHCQVGLATEHCAVCLPGEYRCEQAALQACAPDGTEFVMATTCASAALCNAAAGACTDKACVADSFECAGDVLRSCNEDQTNFVDVKVCAAGLCDRMGKQCDVCIPNKMRCDADALLICDSSGQNEKRQTCPSSTPHCAGSACVQCRNDADCGNGKHCDPNTSRCLECLTDSHCATTLDCRVSRCGAAGACVVSNAPARTSCGPQDSSICTADGRCVQCLDAAQCRTPKAQCNTLSNVCVECTASSHCSAGSACTLQNTCEKSCGNGRLDPNEACDPTVTNDWHCSSSCEVVGGEHTWRLCSTTGQCDVSTESCMMTSGVPSFCAPDASKLGGGCNNAFPNAYRGREFGSLPFCLLSCQSGQCPSHTQCSNALGAAQPLCLPK